MGFPFLFFWAITAIHDPLFLMLIKIKSIKFLRQTRFSFELNERFYQSSQTMRRGVFIMQFFYHISTLCNRPGVSNFLAGVCLCQAILPI